MLDFTQSGCNIGKSRCEQFVYFFFGNKNRQQVVCLLFCSPLSDSFYDVLKSVERGHKKKVKQESVKLINLGVFLEIDFDATDDSSEKSFRTGNVYSL